MEMITFDQPLLGPSGAKLIAYNWAYEWTEDWHKGKGNLS